MPSIAGALGSLPPPSTNDAAAKAFMLRAIKKLNEMVPDEVGDSECGQCKAAAFCILQIRGILRGHGHRPSHVHVQEQTHDDGN
jgi:hypothetical protein